MQRQSALLSLSLASSLLFLSVFTYIGWEAFYAVFGSETKAAIAILILMLDGVMILWLRFLCTNLVKCHQYVERLAGIFIFLILLLGLLDATILILDRSGLASDAAMTANAVLLASLLVIGFLLAWESINTTLGWLRGKEQPTPTDPPDEQPVYGKAGYR